MIGIDNEVLENIQRTATEAAGIQKSVAIIALPDEPAGVYGLVTKDDGFKRVVAQAPPRKVELCSVDQIPDYAARANSDLNGCPAIYFDEKNVTCIVDDGPHSNRLSRATVALACTPEFTLLKEISRHTFTQKEFVSLLRTSLADCQTAEVLTLIQCCRAIDFRSQATGSSTVGHGRESLGRDIQDEVISKYGEIPEEVRLSVRVYKDRAMERRYDVTCLVEVDAKIGSFQLIPIPADLQEAVDAEMELLGNMLIDTGSPTHYGRA